MKPPVIDNISSESTVFKPRQDGKSDRYSRRKNRGHRTHMVGGRRPLRRAPARKL